jgi:hypothetical protein
VRRLAGDVEQRRKPADLGRTGSSDA